MTKRTRVVWLVLGWSFGIFFLLIAAALFGMGGWLQGVLVAGIALLLLPPGRGLERRLARRELAGWARGLAAVGLWSLMVLTVVLFPAKSIYRSPEHEARIKRLYKQELAKWPVPYESLFVSTSYGRIHVVASGPPEAPPVLLFNASGLSAWSWRANIEALSRPFRTYAIDAIGEVGLNEMLARDRVPRTASEVGSYCGELADALGMKRAHVVGASIGGFVATTFALAAPERIDRVVLLGPMGYGSTASTVLTMTLAQGFPVRPVQDATFRWAFGDAPGVRDAFGEWFRLLMVGALPNPIAPSTFRPDQLAKLAAPTLVYFGTRDGVIGDAHRAAALAHHIPNASIEIVESGHLIGAELPEEVNPAIVDFLQERSPPSTARPAHGRRSGARAPRSRVRLPASTET
jgi:pimeloyl-ACP methyl ester carboxylesterase